MVGYYVGVFFYYDYVLWVFLCDVVFGEVEFVEYLCFFVDWCFWGVEVFWFLVVVEEFVCFEVDGLVGDVVDWLYELIVEVVVYIVLFG